MVGVVLINSYIMYSSIIWTLALAVATVPAKPIVARDSKTAVVNFANDTGTPQHLASGLLYGVPDAKNQIPVSNFVYQTTQLTPAAALFHRHRLQLRTSWRRPDSRSRSRLDMGIDRVQGTPHGDCVHGTF